jgi:hypothetical protein
MDLKQAPQGGQPGSPIWLRTGRPGEQDRTGGKISGTAKVFFLAVRFGPHAGLEQPVHQSIVS